MIFARIFRRTPGIAVHRFFGSLRICNPMEKTTLACLFAPLSAKFDGGLNLPAEIDGKKLGEVLDLIDLGEVKVENSDGHSERLPVPPILIIDVRNADEVTTTIKDGGAVRILHIPLPTLAGKVDSVIVPALDALEAEFHQTPVVFTYCMKGIRSAKASDFLNKHRDIPTVSIADGLSSVPSEWLQTPPPGFIAA